MAGSIYGVNGINSIYGVSSIYGINSYRHYLSSIAGRPYSQAASLLNTAAANAFRTKDAPSESSSYLNQLNQSLYSSYLASSVFSMGSKVVASSDSGIVSAAAQWNASTKSYSLNVSNLAAAQKNTGSAFSGDDKSVVGAGLNVFKIKSGTDERNISVAISGSDTNKTAFAKLASAINNSYAGIKATVATDTDNKTYLTLESSRTGTKNAFTITDLQGNAISATGLGNVADKAQNAVYSVDGKQFSSSSNTVALDNGKVQATLKEKGEATIAVVPDAASSGLPDFYTYSNSLFSSGGYFSSLIRGTMFDMLL